MGRGNRIVLTLDFTDHVDFSILRADSRRLSLRAELGPDGSVTSVLGQIPGAEPKVTFFETEVFEPGTWQVLCDGQDLAVGRPDMEFCGPVARGNYPPPRMC